MQRFSYQPVKVLMIIIVTIMTSTGMSGKMHGNCTMQMSSSSSMSGSASELNLGMEKQSGMPCHEMMIQSNTEDLCDCENGECDCMSFHHFVIQIKVEPTHTVWNLSSVSHVEKIQLIKAIIPLSFRPPIA